MDRTVGPVCRHHKKAKANIKRVRQNTDKDRDIERHRQRDRRERECALLVEEGFLVPEISRNGSISTAPNLYSR